MTPLFRRQRWPLLAILTLAICFLLYRSPQVSIAKHLPRRPLPAPNLHPGIPKPANSTYTRTLVIPKTSTEDVSWAQGLLSTDPHLTLAVYDVSHPSSPASGLHAIPQNKGHEVMTYLTHIITHYNNLSDITIFMHAHAIAWHNNDLLLSSSAALVSHLSSPHVVRAGYVNLRCHQDPGCPAHIHTSGNRKPGEAGRQDGEDDANRPEVAIFAQEYFAKRKEAREIDKSLAEKKEKGQKISEAEEKRLRGRIDMLTTEMEVLRKEAMERGKDPRNRAKEAGRLWKEGDGF
ncbi:hypothetical protein H2199_006774 [Coniosporium tulheliwenetii]|uniref:Uncharacterized protein n=1 Tax=Coniosporium tulheliwenetii TaxID=3383036 RepID=A0ACC2YV72_9PEZI|nr:hypothetical protein H2199_006774 [Cladosporium sp. JES 115]